MINIRYFNCDILKDEDLYNELVKRLPRWRQAKIERIKPPGAKRLSAGAGFLLEYAIKEQKITGGVPEIRSGGKPFLKNCEAFKFNLSHSENIAMIAYTSDKSVSALGCDIEKIKQCDIKIAERFFHYKETEFIKNALSDKTDEAFYNVWTLKESFLKATGDGMSGGLDFEGLPLTCTGRHYKGSFVDDNKEYLFYGMRPIKTFVSALCVEGKTLTDNNIIIVSSEVSLNSQL